MSERHVRARAALVCAEAEEEAAEWTAMRAENAALRVENAALRAALDQQALDLAGGPGPLG